MPNDRGWSASPSDVLLHRVINWINGHAEDGPIFRTEDVAQGIGAEPAAVGEVFDLMGTAGWGDAKHFMGGGTWAQMFFVQPRGAAYLRDYAERSRARSHRMNACIDGMLEWLYERDGEEQSSADFAADPRANFLGEPYDDVVIGEAAHTLVDLGLAVGEETMTRHLRGIRITPSGRDVVDGFDSDVRAWRTRALTGRQGDVNVNVDGSTAVTVAVHSPGASQTNTVTTTDHSTQIIGLADAFEQMLPVLGLSGEQMVEATTLIGELREIGGIAEPEPGRVRRLFDGVKALAIAGSGNAAGTGIVALVEQIAHNWPF